MYVCVGDITERHLVDERLKIDEHFCSGRSDGWVDYKMDDVRVNCVNDIVLTLEDKRRAFSCEVLNLTGVYIMSTM